MSKPTQGEIDTTREVLEYIVKDMREYEPYAHNTIEEFDNVLRNIPDESELEDR